MHEKSGEGSAFVDRLGSPISELRNRNALFLFIIMNYNTYYQQEVIHEKNSDSYGQ